MVCKYCNGERSADMTCNDECMRDWKNDNYN
jgi:hypothetical protein